MASQTLALAESGEALKIGLFMPANVIFTGAPNVFPSGILPDSPDIPATTPPSRSSPPPPPPPPPPQQPQSPTFIRSTSAAPHQTNIQIGTASPTADIPDHPNSLPSPNPINEDNDATLTSIQLSIDFTSIAPFPIPSRTAIAVSSCQGSDSCITISGNVFSLVPTQTSTINTLQGNGGSAIQSGSIPSLTTQPFHVLDQRLSYPFSAKSLTIIVVSTASYFLFAIFFILGAFVYLRYHRKSKTRELR